MLLVLLTQMLFSTLGFSQYGGAAYDSSGQTTDSFYYKLDLQVMHFRYEEEGLMNETGILPGVRGELRWAFHPQFGVSLGGYYFDGNLNYDGRTLDTNIPVQQITNDYIRDLRLKLFYRHLGFEASFGMGERELFNDLIISYTRTQTYRYFPLQIGYNWQPFYAAFEYRLWGEGKNVSTTSVVNPAFRDLEFQQNSGFGYALEVGVRYPFGPFEGEIHLIYDFWEVDDSNIVLQTDGNLYVEPANTAQAIILGMGITY